MRFLTRSARSSAAVAAVLACLAMAAPCAWGQTPPDVFGNQARLSAARTAILLSVQQGLSSLPPSNAPGTVYEYDAALDTFVASGQAGPTAFRNPQSLGRGRLAVNVGASYFRLSETLTPAVYEATPAFLDVPVYTAFGLGIDADVSVVTLSATYGVTRNLDVVVTVPITAIDSSARSIYPARASSLPADPQVVALTDEAAIRSVARGIPQTYVDGATGREETAVRASSELASSSGAGLGRVGVGAKAWVPIGEAIALAAAPEVLLPSPSQAELAGPDSVGLVFRLIGSLRLTGHATLLVEAGYEYDTEFAELRRATWDAAATFGFAHGSFDLGFAGSTYTDAIQWAPDTIALENSDIEFHLVGGQSTSLGTVLVDFRAGGRIALGGGVSLTGAVGVPVSDDGVRPDALGSIGLQVEF